MPREGSSSDEPVFDAENTRAASEPILLSSDDEDPSDGEWQVQSVRRLSPNELRRQRMNAARDALRRAAHVPTRPTASHTLFSSYKCPICLCPPTNISVTPCGHIFCGSCLYDSLSTNLRQEYSDYTNGRESGYGESLFTPFGSGGALALANAAGASVHGTRGIFHELVHQRHRQTQDPRPSATQATSATRMRASNGTERIKGVCPVCRGPIKGGFTGLGRKGILGLDIMLGTPKTDDTPDHDASIPKKRQRT